MPPARPAEQAESSYPPGRRPASSVRKSWLVLGIPPSTAPRLARSALGKRPQIGPIVESNPLPAPRQPTQRRARVARLLPPLLPLFGDVTRFHLDGVRVSLSRGRAPHPQV